MQLSQKEDQLFGLLSKKRNSNLGFKPKENLLFSILNRKIKAPEKVDVELSATFRRSPSVDAPPPDESLKAQFKKFSEDPLPFEVKAGRAIEKSFRTNEVMLDIAVRAAIHPFTEEGRRGEDFRLTPETIQAFKRQPDIASAKEIGLSLIGTERRLARLAKEKLGKTRGGPVDILPEKIFGVPTAEIPRKALVELVDFAGFIFNPKQPTFVTPLLNLGIGLLKFTGLKAIEWVRGVIKRARAKKGDSLARFTKKVQDRVVKETGATKEQINLMKERFRAGAKIESGKILPDVTSEAGFARFKKGGKIEKAKGIQGKAEVTRLPEGEGVGGFKEIGKGRRLTSSELRTQEAIRVVKRDTGVDFGFRKEDLFGRFLENNPRIDTLEDIARNLGMTEVEIGNILAPSLTKRALTTNIGRKELFVVQRRLLANAIFKNPVIIKTLKFPPETGEKFAGLDPFRLFPQKFDPKALGVRVHNLVRNRVFNIDKAFLDSEKFITNFDVQLNPLQREALPFIRQGIKNPEILAKIGRQDLIPFIKNPTEKMIKMNEELGKYYDDAHEFLKKNYDDVGFVQNYVTQIWDIPKAKGNEVLNYFSTRNPFTKKRTIPSLEDGIKLGLTPKTTDISELLRIYDQFKIKTVYNKRFAEALKEMVDSDTGLKVMQRMDVAPADWITINHPALNRAMAVGKISKEGIILTKVPVKVHPEIADEVQAIFSKPIKNRAVGALEMVNAFTKKSMLSFTFFHHFALTESAFSSGIGAKALKLWNPYKIIRAMVKKDFEIFKQMPLAKDSIDHGVRYGSLPDFQIARVRAGLLSVERATKKIPVIGKATKLLRTGNDLWDRALWDYYHNTLKLHAYEHQVQLGIKQGNILAQQKFGRAMNADEIEEMKNLIGSFINDSYGGQRWELQPFFRDAVNRQMIHWLLLAPDWTFSVLKQAFAPIKGHRFAVAGATVEKKLAGEILKKRAISFWVKAIFYYNVVTQSVNYYNSQKPKDEGGLGEGRFTWQNDPGHKLNIFIGFNEDGTKRYARPGKQFREVMEWGIDPIGKLGAKLSPVLREGIRQFAKNDPGSGFPTEFAEQEFFESIPERLKSLARAPIPFSLRPFVQDSPRTFLFTLPASKGMTNFKTVKLFKQAIRKFDVDRILEVYFAALENRLDAESLFKTAKSSTKADMTMDDKTLAKTLLKEFRSLASNPQALRDAVSLYKARGIITPKIEKIFIDMQEKAQSIERQRQAVGIQ